MSSIRNGGMWVMMSLALAGLVLALGCGGPTERLNAPPQGATSRPAALQDNFVRMADNAMLAERSMSPVHFVPGSTELNGLGVRRLNRYATLLKVYGGPLHYDGIDEPEELAAGRTTMIKDYLMAQGIGPDHVSVDIGPAGGTGARPIETTEARKGLSPTATAVQKAQERIYAGE